MSSGVEIDVEGRHLSLSNLDKVLYPSGFTKYQVIDTWRASHRWRFRTSLVER